MLYTTEGVGFCAWHWGYNINNVKTERYLLQVLVYWKETYQTVTEIWDKLQTVNVTVEVYLSVLVNIKPVDTSGLHI